MNSGILVNGGRGKRGRKRLVQERTTPITILSAAAQGSVLTLTFNQTVILGNVPRYTITPGSPQPVSARPVAPNAVAITYDAAIAPEASITIPFEDPAIRNQSGGFVAPHPGIQL